MDTLVKGTWTPRKEGGEREWARDLGRADDASRQGRFADAPYCIADRRISTGTRGIANGSGKRSRARRSYR